MRVTPYGAVRTVTGSMHLVEAGGVRALRWLEDGVTPVRIVGEPHDVRLRVVVLPAFSAPADSDELVSWVRRLPRAGRICCVHGEDAQAFALAGRLSAAGFSAEVPARGRPIDV